MPVLESKINSAELAMQSICSCQGTGNDWQIIRNQVRSIVAKTRLGVCATLANAGRIARAATVAVMHWHAVMQSDWFLQSMNQLLARQLHLEVSWWFYCSCSTVWRHSALRLRGESWAARAAGSACFSGCRLTVWYSLLVLRIFFLHSGEFCGWMTSCLGNVMCIESILLYRVQQFVFVVLIMHILYGFSLYTVILLLIWNSLGVESWMRPYFVAAAARLRISNKYFF